MDLMSSKSVALLILFLLLNCGSSHTHSIPADPLKPTSKCPKDTLKYGVCGSWLGLVTEVIGTKPSPECCTLIKGIADVEAVVCLCSALKSNVLGVVNVNMPVALSLLLNACGNKLPSGFKC
ncbi:unnamed protein product [Amaranthus hypochondriacus]